MTDKFYAKHPEKKQARITDDSAAWNRVPSKIKMDEVLSTDILPEDKNNDTDTEEKRDE